MKKAEAFSERKMVIMAWKDEYLLAALGFVKQRWF